MFTFIIAGFVVLSGQALAKEREEKLGLAEYELRVAQEDNMELQVMITKFLGYYQTLYWDVSVLP